MSTLRVRSLSHHRLTRTSISAACGSEINVHCQQHIKHNQPPESRCSLYHGDQSISSGRLRPLASVARLPTCSSPEHHANSHSRRLLLQVWRATQQWTPATHGSRFPLTLNKSTRPTYIQYHGITLHGCSKYPTSTVTRVNGSHHRPRMLEVRTSCFSLDC